MAKKLKKENSNGNDNLDEDFIDEDIIEDDVENEENVESIDDDELELVDKIADQLIGNISTKQITKRITLDSFANELIPSKSLNTQKEINNKVIEHSKEEILENKNQIESLEETNKEVKIEQPQITKVEIKNYKIPEELVYLVKKTKTGINLPKNIREQYMSINYYALVDKDGVFIFYPIYDEDITKLKLINKLKKDEKTQDKKEKSKRKKKSESKEGPQPEWGNYFLHEFEKQDKLKEVLEIAFDKFSENPPNIQDGMDKIKYALVTFMNQAKINDSRVRQAIAFFLLDVIDKFNLPNLIDFIKDKILPEISSKFLYQLTLIKLIYYSFKLRKFEKAKEFINIFIQDVAKYQASELWAIMDSYKKLTKEITRGVNFIIPPEYLIPIKEELKKYFNNTQLDEDYKLQIIEMLGQLNFIDDAISIGEFLYKTLSEESPTREDLKSLIESLNKKPI